MVYNENEKTVFFQFLEKKQRKLALLENKKFDKGCYEPSEHILYLIFFHGSTMMAKLLGFTLNFLSQFLNKSGCNAWMKVRKGGRR